jgi:hypothetical protein
MFLASVDQWVGKTLFIPLIIKFCQLTRQSQFACSRLFWFISALDGFYRAETMFSSILWGGMSVVMMLTASRRADTPNQSFMLFRLLGIVFLVFDVITGVLNGKLGGSEFWLLVLIAEYASTIRTIPPRVTERSAQDRQTRPGRDTA